MRKIVSSLAIAFIFFFSSPVVAEVYYCIADDAIGFDPKADYKQKSYKLRRFQVEIDWVNRMMSSEKIWMTDEIKCVGNSHGTLQCLSIYGSTLAVNPYTLKFYLSDSFLGRTPGDDVVLEHGSCENF